MSLSYTAPSTVAAFMLDPRLVRVIVGPVGSGKSMGCIMELFRRACEQRPFNGVRYSRFALIRNTLQQIKQTMLSDVQTYLGPICSYYVTDSTIKFRVRLPDGTFVHSDWVMIPLDSEQDQKRLLSMQLTGAWVNELREVPIKILSALIGRLGRYPSKLQGGPSWYGLIGDTNPWDTDSDYHDRLVLNPDQKWGLFHQPSGIGPYAENTENLPAGYYDNLAGDRDQEWVAVHVESQWGTSNAGQAVFRRSFDATTHVKDMKLIVNAHRPIMVGLDFGRTPCAVIGQVDSHGRGIIMREVVTENMGLPQMLEEHLLPVLATEPFAGKSVFVVGDPAGRAKSQLSEETAFDVLKQHRLLAYPASTNDIDPRLRAVERMMRSSIMGEPGLQISREGCPTLVKALGNKYRYKKKKDGQLEDVPEKLHPWSDVTDALQYWCLGSQANLVGRVIARVTAPTHSGAPRSSAGWT